MMMMVMMMMMMMVMMVMMNNNNNKKKAMMMITIMKAFHFQGQFLSLPRFLFCVFFLFCFFLFCGFFLCFLLLGFKLWLLSFVSFSGASFLSLLPYLLMRTALSISFSSFLREAWLPNRTGWGRCRVLVPIRGRFQIAPKLRRHRSHLNFLSEEGGGFKIPVEI